MTLGAWCLDRLDIMLTVLSRPRLRRVTFYGDIFNLIEVLNVTSGSRVTTSI